MNNFDIKNFYDQSFTDFDVLEMKINYSKKNACIELNGGQFIENNGSVRYLSKVILLIDDWVDLMTSLYDESTRVYKKFNLFDGQELKNICEFFSNSEEVILRGFRKHAGWIEWKFVKAKIEIHGEEV